MNALPMGCDRCGQIRQLHDAPDHRWTPPSMKTIEKRVAALKQRRAAA